jgi:hypothetical protein
MANITITNEPPSGQKVSFKMSFKAFFRNFWYRNFTKKWAFKSLKRKILGATVLGKHAQTYIFSPFWSEITSFL